MTTPLLGLVLLLQVTSVTNVDDALKVVEEGGPLPRLSVQVGRQAAERVTPTLEAAKVRPLLRIAREAKAYPELAAALARLVTGALEEEVFELGLLELAGLAPTYRDTAPIQPTAYRRLSEAAAGNDEQLSNAAVDLMIPRVPRETLMGLLDEWASEKETHARAEHLLQTLATAPEPAATSYELLTRPLPPQLATALAKTVTQLSKRDPAAVDVALDMIGQGEHGTGGAALRCLGGIRFSDEERWKRAAAVLVPLLDQLDDDLAALPDDVTIPALGAAADLLIPQVVALLPGLALHAGSSTPVRVAALDAMGKVCYRDAPTIDLLIGLLDDKDQVLALGAYEALKRKSGQRPTLPHRSAMWQQWRKQTVLPDAPPQDDETRLTSERKARADAERKAEDRARQERERAQRAGRGR